MKTKADFNEVVEDYKDGMPVVKIIKKYRMSPSTLYTYLHRTNVPERKRSWDLSKRGENNGNSSKK